MRFLLAVISATTILSNMVNATPPPVVGQSNMDMDATQIKGQQTFVLNITEAFETFHWRIENNITQIDRVFTLELSEPAEFQITDFLMGGNVFEVLDNGKSIGSTSEPGEGGSVYAATPEEALEEEGFSKGAYALDAGQHQMTIKVAESLHEKGTGAVRVVQILQAFYNSKEVDKSHDDKSHNDDGSDDLDGLEGTVDYTITETFSQDSGSATMQSF